MSHRKNIDPGASLKETVETALSPSAARPTLKQPIEELGRRIFGMLFNKLLRVGVGDVQAEAEEAYQQFCLRVLQRLRRWGGEVSDGWFWRVANSVFLNHLERRLGKRRQELPLEITQEDSEHLTPQLLGTVTSQQLEGQSAERINNRVLQCLDRLPARMSEYLYLDLIERLPGSEIAKIMGLEPKSHAANKAKAIKRLRDELLKESLL